jgi:AcrR family transcriptional regulator
MGRWEPGAGQRLVRAALDLFVEEGYERTTVAEIAERAGVTERTFFRYFADKREVLFAGGHEMEAMLVKAVAEAPPSASPLEAMAGAFEIVGADLFADRLSFARQRQVIINSTPDLQERELLKLASITTAIAAALRDRGASEAAASLTAETGMAVFKTAFARWLSETSPPDLGTVIRETFADLKAVVA